MSNEQDLRAMTLTVAKWCGYTNIRLTEMFDEVADHNGHTRVRLPNFAESLDAMRKVEDEIERRGLLYRYRAALDAMWRGGAGTKKVECTWTGYDNGEFLIRATAAQRLAAAARVIEEVSR